MFEIGLAFLGSSSRSTSLGRLVEGMYFMITIF